MLPSEELLPFISATSSPSVYNLSSARWNFSFTHVTLHFLAPLLFLRLFGPLFHFSPIWSFSFRLYQSLTFTPNRVLICFYYFFSSSFVCFFFYFFSLAMSLVWCPTTQVWGKVRWASEVQRNNNNRMHLAKETLSEFHYSTLDCVCVFVSLHVCKCVCLEL